MSRVKNEMERLHELQELMGVWILEMTTAAGSGHPTSSLSAVEIMSVMMFGSEESDDAFFHFDIENPEDLRNDRLIFSKGHASPLYYALWAGAGAVSEEKLMTFRQFDSVLEGHPTRRFPLTEVPTGSLGQGLSVGVGEALALRAQGSDARVFVLLGDSEMAEGQVWEAMAVAAHYKLDNLVAVVDVNRLGQRGETMLGYDTDVYKKRAEAFGWHAIVVDGHDNDEIAQAYGEAASVDGKSTMIIARTLKGHGVSFLADKEGWHGKTLSENELEKALTEIGEVDRSVRYSLHKRSQNVQQSVKDGSDSKNFVALTYSIGEKVAPRSAYGEALATLAQTDEAVVALDAETSNSTRSAKVKEKTPEQFYEMFIAEQNMVSVAVGMARRGLRPFVSTFAAFFTRAADQIRMAQYAEVDVTFAGSHCGVSIGADGASQMGLEDMALFSALRESVILYPADATSTNMLTVLARSTSGISYLRMTREALPVLYSADEEFEIGGSKVLRQSENDVATIIAAGITVHEALKAADVLAREDVYVRVVDCYSVRPLDTETVRTVAQETGYVIVAEDHHENGGLGTAVQTALSGMAVGMMHLCVRQTPRSGTSAELLAYEKIDATAIARAVRSRAEMV